MVRLLVQFTEAQARFLRAEARRRRRPVAALVRESVEAHVVKPATRGTPTPDKWERALLAVGGFRSGARDLGENHDRYLGQRKRW
ncbi:MAG: CopG family transcriptional regulator [Verrucomicrobia bacterium]|nr:CopG family transcriptional regulator [Verrucomicrobiota bacterium]